MADRAYSTFTIKSADEDQRILEGIATTPSTDRMDDIVEPRGGIFTLPLPFLWQHSKGQPAIGHVIGAQVTDAGIHVRVKIEKDDEPGPLKDLLDLAWRSIKKGLVRGLSIGFRPLESEPIKNSFGVRFKSWELLEVSGVTIPANADASITMIKSLATDERPASGSGSVAFRSPSPGVSGAVSVAQKGAPIMAKTYVEQIKELEATRQAKAARQMAIQEKVSTDGRTKDAAEREEFDTITGELKAIDAELVDLTELEKAVKATAKPVTADTVKAATDSRASVVTVKDTLPKGIEFARYAMCLAAAKGDTMRALEIAKHRYPDQSRIQDVLKGAVSAGSTTDPVWAGALVNYTTLQSDFIEFLMPQTIIGKFGQGGIPSLRRIPFKVRILGQTAGSTGYWVGQGQPKPVTSAEFEAVYMDFAKVANIAVITEELARFSSPSAEALVRDSLAKALIARLDTDFVDPSLASVPNVSPASITYGVTPLQTAGSSAADVRVDIAALFAPFIAANITPTNGVFIMSNTTALALSLMRNALGQVEFPGITMLGGTFAGLPVIASEYVGAVGSPGNNLVILLNASDIYLADDGGVVIDASREASLEMASDPTNSPAAQGSPYAPTATHQVSMWQTNSIALRAERFINWQKRRSAAVAFLDNVIWGAGGGSPA